MKTIHHTVRITTHTRRLELRNPQSWLNIGIGIILVLAAVAGATDLALQARWPWPADALEDPLRLQLVMSAVLAYLIYFTLTTVIRVCPILDEDEGY